MVLDTKEKKALNLLLSLGKAILEEYDKAETGEFSCDTLLRLLDEEDSLINMMELTKEKLDHIIKSISDKFETPINTPLPLSLTPFMTKATYPYLRLITRLSDKYNSLCSINDGFLIPACIDLEIGLLYNSLVYDSEIFVDMEDELRAYSRSILMESPRIERAVLERGMQPLQCIDDAFAFEFDLSQVVNLYRALGIIAYPSSLNAQRGKKKRFSLLFREGIALTSNYMKLYKSGQDEIMSRVILCIAYFKTLVATQSDDIRRGIYEDYQSEKFDMDEDYRFLMEYSESSIENDLVPRIRKFDFVDRNQTL